MKAISYCRVSSKGQENNTSLGEQYTKIKAYAFSQEVTIVDSLEDVASGKDDNRPGYQKLVEAIKAKEIDTIIVYKLDRLYRSLINILRFVELCKEYQISILSVKENVDTSSAVGKLVLNVMASFAEYERDTINQRVKEGKEAKLREAKEGKRKVNLNSKGLIGYSKDWEIEKDKADIVKKAFSLYSSKDCTSLAKLSKLLEAEYKIKFSHQRLSSMLRNRSYLGELKYNDTVIKDHHDSLVDCRLFGKVQKKLKERNKKHDRTSKRETKRSAKGSV